MKEDFQKNNMYSRHHNKKALEKKARAKSKHFDSMNTMRDLHFEIEEESADMSAFSQALVTESRNGIFQIILNHEEKEAKLSKAFPFELHKDIVVGDHVLVAEDGEDISVIRRLPRKSFIARLRKDNTRFTGQADAHVLAANVDVGVIVASVDDPPFNQNLVDRYLIVCNYGKVKPLLCLTKTDLSEKTPDIVKYYQEKLGIEVVQTSAKLSIGIEEISAKLKDKVAVVLGKSGVGKSTLINAINPHFGIRTNEVSGKSHEGRHTTTASQMYAWSENSYIIDTPGIRALNIEHINPLDLQYYFPEFEAYRVHCKYNDCMHIHEPECGIKDAVRRGTISPERYASYRKLVEE